MTPPNPSGNRAEALEMADGVERGLYSAWLCAGCDTLSAHLPFVTRVVCCHGHRSKQMDAAALRSRTSENDHAS